MRAITSLEQWRVVEGGKAFAFTLGTQEGTQDLCFAIPELGGIVEFFTVCAAALGQHAGHGEQPNTQSAPIPVTAARFAVGNSVDAVDLTLVIGSTPLIFELGINEVFKLAKTLSVCAQVFNAGGAPN